MDERGSFLEWFKNAEIQADCGRPLDVAQANWSVSRRGVLRGIHFAEVPPGQAKYVTCVKGAVLDVVVDLRTGSPGFGRWDSVQLNDESRRAVFIAEGLGHAFLALSEEATVLYLCSVPYIPGREHGIHPMDASIGIAWPPTLEVILSGKDAAAPSLHEAQAAGLLPDYSQCQAHLAALRELPGRSRPELGGNTPGGERALSGGLPPAGR